MGFGREYQRFLAVIQSRRDDLQPPARGRFLLFHDLIRRLEDLVAVGATDEFPEFDLLLEDGVGHGRIELPVKCHARFRRVGSPGHHRLGRLRIGVRDFENPPFAFRPGAPVRQSAVAADIKVAFGGNRQVEREHAQAGDQKRLAHVAVRGLDQADAPDFAARFARHEGVALPPFGAEESLARRARHGRVQALTR